MATSWNFFILLPTVVTVLLMQAQIGETTDDMSLNFCRSVCWSETTLAAQCESENCNSTGMPRRMRDRCSDRCYRESTRCWGFCRNSYQNVLEQCLPQCTDMDVYEFCMLDCCVNRALTMKHRRQNRRGTRRRPPTPPPNKR